MDVMDFFRMSAGQWNSQRTTHHLPFRRAELGGSNILVEALAAAHPSVIEICQLHDVDPALAVGGAYVTWHGAMAWDKDDENHQGSTVFALVPDADDPKQGQLLRERGYAEIVPVIGRYEIDGEDGLLLITEYETMSSIERFWFANPNLRLRTSVVKRFGGFSTASFCAESRLAEPVAEPVAEPETPQALAPLSAFGW
ncbi:MAG: phycobiliprotein lyase [Leptolyngbya sp. DLM2.Bin27]|nr:MAG: phycobiliprotein lyase [Leptolyngbya sp. DLM2.Bin27]